MYAPLMRKSVVLIAFAATWAQPLDFDGTVVVDPNGDGTSLAYLPPPAVTNHASSIEQLPDGTLLLAWFTGLKEEAAGCAIAVARLPAGSSQWSNPTVVSQRPGYSNQNPVLFYDAATNFTHLYHSQLKANAGEGLDNLWHLVSMDGGLSWSTPELFFAVKNGGVFDRNRIIVRADGSLLFPLYYTTAGPPNAPFVLISDLKNHSLVRQLLLCRESGSSDVKIPRCGRYCAVGCSRERHRRCKPCATFCGPHRTHDVKDVPA